MIYLGIIASLCADFIFQSKKQIELKSHHYLKGNLSHALVVFIVYLITFSFVLIKLEDLHIFITLMIVIITLTILHFFIDLLKSFVLKRNKDNAKVDLNMFIIDQILHFLSVILVFTFIPYEFNLDHHLLIVIMLFLVVVFIGDFIVRKTFKAIKLKNYDKKEDEIKGMGSLIGKIERAIIFSIFILGHPEVTIAVIAIKSIARFPEFNNEDKNNDYFILGNLLSVFISISGFVIYLLLTRYT